MGRKRCPDEPAGRKCSVCGNFVRKEMCESFMAEKHRETKNRFDVLEVGQATTMRIMQPLDRLERHALYTNINDYARAHGKEARFVHYEETLYILRVS